MLRWIDGYLNRVTMYRLVLYYLAGLIVVAVIESVFKILPFNPITLLASTVFIISVARISNTIFSWAFHAPTNVESVYITACILALIITPASPSDYLSALPLLIWAPILAMASKYILAIRKKHIFNPVAIAVVITAFVLGLSASWWVGTAAMVPFVIIGGALVARKTQRFDLIFAFLLISAALMTLIGVSEGSAPGHALKRVLLDTPIFFFAFVMLTEPLTMPPTRALRMIYGAVVGVLFTPALHIEAMYSTPELALVIGNLFSYLVSPKEKLMLTLKEKIERASGVFELVFASDRTLAFRPGQYLEWTLAHPRPDSRGNRRYFTIASSPTEPDIRLGVKSYPHASTFKKKLFSLNPGDYIVASELSGEFTLPRDPQKKLVFIAGGIGVTPFRSMVKYLIDKKETRDVVLLYSNRTSDDIAYRDIFSQAKEVGVKTIYTVTDNPPAGWPGKTGPVTTAMIQAEIPDYKERTFYISGPHGMVVAFEDTLKGLGIPKSQIKVDFFPGFV